MFLTTSIITLWTLLLKCDRESFPRGNYIGISFPPLLSLWSVPVWLHPQMQLAKLTGPVLPYSNSSRFGGHYCLPVALPQRPASDGFMHLLSPLSRRLGHPIDSAHSKGLLCHQCAQDSMLRVTVWGGLVLEDLPLLHWCREQPEG